MTTLDPGDVKNAVTQALTAKDAEIARLYKEGLYEQGQHEKWKVCTEAAEARIAELEGALRDIRDQDECEIALDPDWPRRIARATLTPPPTPEGEDHE